MGPNGKWIVSAVLSMFAFVSAAADAGNSSGGGGKGIVCRDNLGQIQSVELLDLWEARVLNGQKILANAQKPVSEQVMAAIEALRFAIETQPNSSLSVGAKHYDAQSDYMADNLRLYSRMFLENTKYVVRLRGVTLKPTDDGLETAYPDNPNCKIEQIVTYVDSPFFPKILVNQDIVDKMDAANQAALIAHEALYVNLRGYNALIGDFMHYREESSARVRRAIGYVFSGNQFPSLASLLGKSYVSCSKGYGFRDNFYFYEDSDGNTQMINTVRFGKPILGFFPQANRSAIPMSVLINIAKQRKCRRPPNPAQPLKGYYGNSLGGPIDFQDQFWFTPACGSDGKSALYLSEDTGQTSGQKMNEEMVCYRHVEK